MNEDGNTYSITEPGRIAYDAYCATTGRRSAVTGESLPTYDEQRPEIREAWDVAGQAVWDAAVDGVRG